MLKFVIKACIESTNCRPALRQRRHVPLAVRALISRGDRNIEHLSLSLSLSCLLRPLLDYSRSLYSYQARQNTWPAVFLPHVAQLWAYAGGADAPLMPLSHLCCSWEPRQKMSRKPFLKFFSSFHQTKFSNHMLLNQARSFRGCCVVVRTPHADFDRLAKTDATPGSTPGVLGGPSSRWSPSSSQLH